MASQFSLTQNSNLSARFLQKLKFAQCGDTQSGIEFHNMEFVILFLMGLTKLFLLYSDIISMDFSYQFLFILNLAKLLIKNVCLD